MLNTYIVSVIKTFGLINCILAAIIALCALSWLVIIFACLFFLMGF